MSVLISTIRRIVSNLLHLYWNYRRIKLLYNVLTLRTNKGDFKTL